MALTEKFASIDLRRFADVWKDDGPTGVRRAFTPDFIAMLPFSIGPGRQEFLAVQIVDGTAVPVVISAESATATSTAQYERDAGQLDQWLPDWDGFDFGTGSGSYITSEKTLMNQARTRLANTD